MIDVVAMGELLIDFTPGGTNSKGMKMFTQNPGGAPANVLAMNARLGGKTAFIGKVGQDAFGTFLRDVLRGERIDTSGLVFDPVTPTTLAFVHLDEKGDRSFSFYRSPGADQMLAPKEVALSLIDDCGVFHFGSVSLTHDPSRSAVFHAAEYAKKQCRLVSFDPNIRPMLWDNTEDTRIQIERAMKYADILKVSEEEMAFLTGTQDLDAGSKCLLDKGMALVLVSLGEQGAYYRNHCSFGCVPGYPVNAVDTTGAGDAFIGAFLWKAKRMMREELAFMNPVQLKQMVKFANAAGALTTTGSGAIPAMPDLEQIQSFMQEKEEVLSCRQ